MKLLAETSPGARPSSPTPAEYQPITSYRIRPHAANILGSLENGTLELKVTQVANLSIEVNGDVRDNLHLFANPIESDKPNCDAPNVLCLEPGLNKFHEHQTTVQGSRWKVERSGNRLNVTAIPRAAAGSTPLIIYLAGGAVYQGHIRVTGSEPTNISTKGDVGIPTLPMRAGQVAARPENPEVVIRGRGIIDLSSSANDAGPNDQQNPDADRGPVIALKNASNILLQGITLKQGTGFHVSGRNVQRVKIDNVKILGAQVWGDGIDMVASSDITIDGCFIRTSDDTIAVYESRIEGDSTVIGQSKRWEVLNSVLWADAAHPIFVGVHGSRTDDTGNDASISYLLFKNIDVLEVAGTDPKYYGAMSIGAGDLNTIKHLTFYDIRVEHIAANNRLIDVQFKKFPATAMFGRSISNVLFERVAYGVPAWLPNRGPWFEDRNEKMPNSFISGRDVCVTDGETPRSNCEARWGCTSTSHYRDGATTRKGGSLTTSDMTRCTDADVCPDEIDGSRCTIAHRFVEDVRLTNFTYNDSSIDPNVECGLNWTDVSGCVVSSGP